MGRLYLPRETLRAAGISTSDPAAVLADPALDQACADIVELAKTAFHEADAIMAQSPRRVVRAPRIMGQAYRLILEALIARGFAPPREKVRLPRAKLILIVLRNLV
jgi:phytoene synthase